MSELVHLFQTLGPLVVVPILFVVVGAGMWINILWGLVTGGPRALQEPGAPYLYDRVYYLFFLIAIIGWTGGLLSFPLWSHAHVVSQESGFMVGWGICAIGMGLIFWLRRDMMMHGAAYLSKHGFWLFRVFHHMQVRQLERQPAFLRKLLPIMFIVAGIGVLAFELPHLSDGLAQARDGATALVNVITHP